MVLVKNLLEISTGYIVIPVCSRDFHG